jgi:hypothetical protein
MEELMSIDRYYTQIDCKWVRKDMRWDAGECIVDDQPRDVETDFWVDISHGRNFLIDERYYFHDLASALEFYVEGWRQRQFLDNEGNGVGLDNKGLCSRGRLIHGHSIYGDDAPGHEGESLLQILGAFVRKMNQEARYE